MATPSEADAETEWDFSDEESTSGKEIKTESEEGDASSASPSPSPSPSAAPARSGFSLRYESRTNWSIDAMGEELAKQADEALAENFELAKDKSKGREWRGVRKKLRDLKMANPTHPAVCWKTTKSWHPPNQESLDALVVQLIKAVQSVAAGKGKRRAVPADNRPNGKRPTDESEEQSAVPAWARNITRKRARSNASPSSSASSSASSSSSASASASAPRLNWGDYDEWTLSNLCDSLEQADSGLTEDLKWASDVSAGKTHISLRRKLDSLKHYHKDQAVRNAVSWRSGPSWHPPSQAALDAFVPVLIQSIKEVAATNRKAALGYWKTKGSMSEGFWAKK